MQQEKKQQWNESYPAIAHISADIENEYAYVLCDEKHIVAYEAIVFDGEPTYRTINGK